MIKQVVIGCIVFLSIFPAVAHAEEFPILDLQVEIRQAHCCWLTETQRISMQAVIGYMKELNNNTDTSATDELLLDFTDQSNLMTSLTTHIALNNAIRQLRNITTDFRSEARNLMVQHPGKGFELLNRIKTALDENDDYLGGLLDAYWNLRTNNELIIFDTRVDHAQEMLDILSARGYNISEAQDKLDEIKEKRDDVESAYQSRNRNEIHEMNREVYMLSEQLRNIVHDLQVVIPEEHRVHFWIRVAERAVNRTESIIRELEQLGFNISSLQLIHDRISSDLTDAQNAYKSDDMESAKNALRLVKQDFIFLRDAYRDLLDSETISQEMTDVIESTMDALDDAVEEMEESLE